MRAVFLIFALFSCAIIGFADFKPFICGTQPGEVYFAGQDPSQYWPATKLYRSTDYGEHIELVENELPTFYMAKLLQDAADSTLHLFIIRHYLSTDGGQSWSFIDSIMQGYCFASGVISGELYRVMVDQRILRSENFGRDYYQCGGDLDSVVAFSIDLGVDSGEVYIYTEYGLLYYSDDYAESFVFLNDLMTNFGLGTSAYVCNGALPGECFIFENYGFYIWRVENYGIDAELLINFPDTYFDWVCNIACSRQPGELYFFAKHTWGTGGRMHIYHTTDYFQTYTMYEHLMPVQGVDDPQISILPSTINLNIWPNPTNAAFNISYELNTMQDVRLKMYDLLGRQVWQNDAGMQTPGRYLLRFANDGLPSGVYFLQINTNRSTTLKTVTILK